jgi:hypothetical protein
MPYYHIAQILSKEMARLKCTRVTNSFYSSNLVVVDFCLFGVLKQKLQGIDISDDKEPKSEILTIVQAIPSNELKTSFDRWIERCQWAAANAGTIIHHNRKTPYLFYICTSHGCPY